MELLSSLFLLLAGVCVAFAGYSVLNHNAAGARLRRMAAGPLIAEEDVAANDSLMGDGPSWLVRAIAPLSGDAAKKDSTEFSALRLRIIRAGFRGNNAPLQYLALRIATAVGLPAVAWFLPLRSLVAPSFEMIVPVFALGLGYVGPSYYIDYRTKKRQREIHRELPIALDLMVVCIEAGLGLMQTIQRVAEELQRSSPILSQELALVAIESRTGRSNAQALKSLATRTGVQEVSILVAMLAQTERFGTSLADSLRVHCDTMRVRRMQAAEELAAKAPLKMLFPTSLILFALTGLILGLAAIKAIETLA